MLTSEQCRAARALLNWSQAELSDRSKVSLSTVGNFEADRSLPMANNLAALEKAFGDGGIVFIPENGGGLGVRLAKPRGAS